MILKKEHKTIIIGGFYRSGTTLFRKILNGHKSIFCSPEIKFLTDFHNYYLRDDISHLRFFNSLHCLELPESVLLKEFGNTFIKVYRRAAGNKKVIAIKNPENSIFLDSWDIILKKRFFFVHCVRNPLDTLASLKEASFNKTIPLGLDNQIIMYRQYYAAAQNYCSLYPTRSMIVKYEDFVENPKYIINQFLKKIDLCWDEDILKKAFNSPEKAGLGDSKADKSVIIKTDSIGRGMNEFSIEDQNMIISGLPELSELYHL